MFGGCEEGRRFGNTGEGRVDALKVWRFDTGEFLFFGLFLEMVSTEYMGEFVLGMVFGLMGLCGFWVLCVLRFCDYLRLA